MKPIRQPAIEKDFVEAVQLDGAVERAVGGEHRRRLVAVEGDVGVREVVHEHELPLARQVDQPLHQLGRRDGGRRVVRERDDHDARGGLRRVDRLLDPREQVVLVQARVDDGGAGEPRRDQVDRVARARHDRAVAGLEQHPHQVRQALLRADRRDDVHVGIELDAELRPVALADRLAEVGQPAARRVAVVHRLGGGLRELLDGDVGRGDVGVAEAEVDHVATLAPELALQLVDRREDVGREIVDSPELHRRRREEYARAR